MKKCYLLSISFLAIAGMVLAQDVPEHVRKNVIKIDVTQTLYPTSLVISYERITRPNQSFCVTAGYEEFPPLVNVNSTIRVRQDLKRHGYRAGVEYRFYLKKENKYQAPHGLYLGPYYMYHYFYNKREVEVESAGVKELGELETDFMITNLGIQLGYQFVINNRWTFDLVTLGPSISNYKAKLKLNGEFTFDEDEVQSEILLKLLDRFPMLNDLLTNKEVSSQGRYDAWAYGWRVQFQVGYHFGRKKTNKE